MNGKDLLSGMSHIREDFIAEAEKNGTERPQRRLVKYLLIAAIVSVLGFSVFAMGTFPENADWFVSFFSETTRREAQDELTDRQREILNEGLVPINQTVTVNGYTLTLNSGLCDGYRMLLKFHLTAPEGTVLEGRDYALSPEIRRLAQDGAADSYGTGTIFTELLADENPKDNTITLLLDHQILPGGTSDYYLTDGGTCLIRFHDIQEVHGYQENYERITLCEGTWEFEFQFRDDLLVTQSVEALDKPIRCDSHMWIDNFIFRNKEIPVKTKVTSMEIRALTATVNFQRPLIARYAGVELDDPVYLVMEDGTKILARQEMTAYRYDGTDDTLYTFEQPISIRDVAWVEFPGGVRVQVSREGEG